MKAIFYEQFGKRDVLQFGELPDPKPVDKELLLQVERSSINYVDIRERQGTYNKPETHGAGIKLPHVPGLQAVGRVIEVGSKAEANFTGKRVVAYTPKGGGYAEKVIADSNLCIEIPESANADLFAALPNQGLTAYLLLTASTKVEPGDTVLVQGASGGVGSLAVQIARILGAGTVLGTASTERKLQFIRELGADEAINYTQDNWPQMILEKTNGNGVDILLESIGGDIFDRNFECLAPFGRYVIYGSTRGPGQPFSPRRLMQKSQSLTGFYLPVFGTRPELLREGMEFLTQKTLERKITPSIARLLSLRDTAEGHRLLEDREVHGTVILNATNL